MKDILLSLPRDIDKCGHAASVVGKALRFPKRLPVPAFQRRAVMVSAVFPLLSAYPRDASSSKSAKGAAVLRKKFGCHFPFLIGFPPPILEIEEPYPLAGTDVNVTCAGHVLTSPSPTLRLQGAPDNPAPGEPAWLLLTTREEDDGRNFSCEASLEVQGQQLIKTTTVQLHVLCEYRPDLSSQYKENYCPISRDLGQQLHN